MKRIKIGQIGIGHNHAEAKMLAVRKFTELFEIVGYAEENERWVEKRGSFKGYEGLPRMKQTFWEKSVPPRILQISLNFSHPTKRDLSPTNLRLRRRTFTLDERNRLK